MTRDTPRIWVHVVFSILVLSLIFTCLSWIDMISPPEEKEAIVLPFQDVPPRRLGGGAPALPNPDPHGKPVETPVRSAGGIAIEK